MAKILLLSLALTTLLINVASAGNWNILSQFKTQNKAEAEALASKSDALKSYCESWRVSVELNNIRWFNIVPQECVSHVKKYMTSSQYQSDVERAVDEVMIYISKTCCETHKCDGKDAWIFDIDQTLLSTVPYYKKHGFGGEYLNVTDFEEWIKQRKAPAITSVLRLFNEIRDKGMKIHLISARKEYLRAATNENLIQEGFHGWTTLTLRNEVDELKYVGHYKAEARRKIESEGYRVWGVMADQWNSFDGCPAPRRTFKLPNSMYYVS